MLSLAVENCEVEETSQLDRGLCHKHNIISLAYCCNKGTTKFGTKARVLCF